MKRRVVITGMGIVSPVGNDLKTAWRNILNGFSGIDKITRFDVNSSDIKIKIAGEVKNFDITKYISFKQARNMDTFLHYGIAAGIQAWNDSQIKINEVNSERIGVLIGSGIGGLPRIENTKFDYIRRGARRISPFFIPSSLINMINGQLSIKYGIKGPSYSVVSACTTSLHCIGDASRIIEYGDADVMLTGGSDSTISPLGIGGFAAMKALSKRNHDPKTASRPWDIDRDGFVLGEGSGVLILEEYEHAKKRHAKIYGEISGYGMSTDAYHITSPNKDGPYRGMLNALKNGNINIDEIDYVNAHGTSTKIGDQNENDALKLTFKNYSKNLIISSTKSMTGHLLGAAGGIEAIFTVLSVYNQVCPPTINIFNQDPRCELNYCPNLAKPMKIRNAISNSFGFGGTNGSIIISKI